MHLKHHYLISSFGGGGEGEGREQDFSMLQNSPSEEYLFLSFLCGLLVFTIMPFREAL